MKWCAFDIETSGRESAFVMGSVYSDRAQVTTDNIDTFHTLLRAHAAEGYTFAAHNAEFDVVNALWRHGEDVTLHYYNSAFTTAYWFWHRRRSSAQIWDSMNLAAGLSLAALGDSLGTPKLSTPQRLKGIDPDRFNWICERHSVGECVDCYCLRDAEIVFRFVSDLDAFLAGYGLEMRRTLAANAVQLWRLWDPERQLTLRSDRITQLAARALHGGRVEVYQHGEFGPVYTYDHRNFYLSLLLETPMPDPRFLIYAEGWPRHLDWHRVEGVIEADVYQPPTRYPVLPAVHGERIFYPVGLLSGCWTIAELRAALDRGAELRKVHRLAWSDRLVYPFTGFAGALLVLDSELRDQANPRRAVVKTLGNALPGRLGMVTGGKRQIYRRRTPGLKPRDLAGAELLYANSTAYLIKEHAVPRPPSTSNVLWAANITAAGRLKQLAALEAAGDAAIYGDTDSVFSTLPIATGRDIPGALRDTGEYRSGLFISPKMYRLEPFEGETVRKAKGVPREVVEAYFKTGSVKYDSNLGVIRAVGMDAEPGTWVQMKRERMLTPARRQLLNPAALVDATQTSDTEPIVFGADGPEIETPVEMVSRAVEEPDTLTDRRREETSD